MIFNNKLEPSTITLEAINVPFINKSWLIVEFVINVLLVPWCIWSNVIFLRLL